MFMLVYHCHQFKHFYSTELRCTRSGVRCLTQTASFFYCLMRILSVTQSIICSAKCNIAVLKSLMQNMASIVDVFINSSRHIEVINEESVKLMQLEYGNPAVTRGEKRCTAYGKQVVKGSLKDYPRHAGLHFSMDDFCLLN